MPLAAAEMEDIMPNKKSKFWNFFISFVPGAGQMYQGFLKRGTSLMLMFFGEVCLSALLRMEVLLFAAPVIWFYAFFDSINTNSLSDEDFCQVSDRYLLTGFSRNFNISGSQFRIPAAIVLIITGSYILLENILYVLKNIFGLPIAWDIFYWIMDYLPRFVFSALIIMTGVYLVRGKKSWADNDDIYIQKKDNI